ncbi:serine protease inhibitor Kazal-type 1-like [Danaus plexippus]|uniref:serine protease inhibitor Kazal-type 1-like n=1 Tax=Danaus plexippus TaxID=13037 RepID=UPI002AB191F3|nr:serine protease inhibitor Kazal-type 1-like [Danaus plexippus]
MILITLALIFATLYGNILLYYLEDDLPVLEYLGCKDCLRVYVPVCGTDNKTYNNACKLNCLNTFRKKEEWVYIKRYGPCVTISIQFNSLFGRID